LIAGTTLQIHPSLRCNLRCKHCYSNSGPSARLTRSAREIVATIDDAAELGYERLSVSGGEPLLYANLREVLLAARHRGMRTTVTTNGTVFDSRRLGALDGVVDLVAVSIDGPPEVHDSICNHRGSFRRSDAGLTALHSAGIPIAIAHTLTTQSLVHLPWLIGYAREKQASLVQIHPLQRTGRAVAMDAEHLHDDEALQRIFAYALLRQLTGLAPAVHVDLAPSSVVAANLRGMAERLARCERDPELVETLVLDADGTLRAYSANANEAFILAKEGTPSLRDAWRFGDWPMRLARELSRVADEVSRLDEGTPLNWFDLIVDGASDRKGLSTKES
jgi:organic radical activating enzyme